MNRQDDVKVLQEARPFIISVVAFLIFMRFGIGNIRAGSIPTDDRDGTEYAFKLAEKFFGKTVKMAEEKG